MIEESCEREGSLHGTINTRRLVMKKINFKFWESYSDFNYCYGKLHLLVDGEEWISDGWGCLDKSFGCWIDEKGEEHFKKGNWKLNEAFFKDFNEDEKKIIFKLVNENIAAECCGGCM